MQLSYPTRLLEHDCTCGTQLFPFCHTGLITKIQFIPIQGTIGSFQLSNTVVPDSGTNSTLICMKSYLITGSFLLYSSLLSGVCTIVDSEPKLDHFFGKPDQNRTLKPDIRLEPDSAGYPVSSLIECRP